MTKANRIISALLALFMTASVAQISALAEDVLPEDIPDTEESGSSAEEEFPEEENDSEESAIDDIYLYENEVVAPVEYEVQANLSSKRQAVVDRAYAWYNSTWTLTQPLVLWHNPASSSGITIPAGTTVRGIPYTQFNCLYSIDGTLPGSTDYFSLDESSTYATVVNTYCPGVQSNRTAPKYGAECVQLVYDAWYHGDDSIGKRDVSWSLIIGDNKKRGLVDEIEYSAIQPGDALAISSHIRLVVGVNDNNTPDDCTDDSYEIIEQTTSFLSTSNIGTSKATYTYTRLNNGGYVPYRYNKLDEGTVVDPDPESYTLTGIIRNATEGSADYGKVVEGVTVTRKAADGSVIDTAVTDAEGNFSFTFTGEKGDYIFMFSKTGFQTKETAAMTIHQTSPSLGAFVIYEEEIVDEGTCGTNLTWTLDSDGTLTISGEGAMTDYNGDVAPWDAKRAQIKNVLIGNGITRIGDYAFYECTRLTEISIPDSVTNIGDSAFYHCSRLTQISIPDSVTSIGSYAFCDCSRLTQISIPDSVTGIKGYTFYDCSSLTQISIPDSVTIIGNSAFSYCSSLTKISIPDSVISIGDSAFYHCSSLTEISMSNSVSSIGEYAFSYCSSLAQISIPNSVISIRSYVFSNCSSLTEVSIPNSISSIGEYAFSYCSSLTEVSIPDSVSSIGGYAFSYCSSLAQISIPNSVTNLGEYAFSYCSSLTEISIPDSVTYLGYATFYYCSSLTKISIPDSVIHIEDYTFCNCSSLTEISIPDSVTSIGNIAFAHCSSLTEISIPDSVTSIGFSAFLYCSSLTEISIPDSVISIGYAAFGDCSRLTKISIPGSITSIEYSTFCKCSSLTEISIPDSVTNIGDHAFYSCTNLTSIYFYGDTPIVGSDAFSNTASNLTLYYIHGKSGWTSPTWNGYNTATFTPDSVDPKPTVPGDLTGDGVLDYFDISALYSAYQSGEVDPATMDVNNDGVVDYYDVAKLYAAFRGTIVLS